VHLLVFYKLFAYHQVHFVDLSSICLMHRKYGRHALCTMFRFAAANCIHKFTACPLASWLPSYAVQSTIISIILLGSFSLC